MSHEVRVDPECCIGAGNCEFVAPATFSLGADGVAKVKDPEGDSWALIEQAKAECPSMAIAARRLGDER